MLRLMRSFSGETADEGASYSHTLITTASSVPQKISEKQRGGRRTGSARQSRRPCRVLTVLPTPGGPVPCQVPAQPKLRATRGSCARAGCVSISCALWSHAHLADYPPALQVGLSERPGLGASAPSAEMLMASRANVRKRTASISECDFT